MASVRTRTWPGSVTEEQLTRRDVSDQRSLDTGNGGQVIRPRAIHRVRSGSYCYVLRRGTGKIRYVQFLFLCNPINNDTRIIRMKIH